jgi:hypothetical protein
VQRWAPRWTQQMLARGRTGHLDSGQGSHRANEQPSSEMRVQTPTATADEIIMQRRKSVPVSKNDQTLSNIAGRRQSQCLVRPSSPASEFHFNCLLSSANSWPHRPNYQNLLAATELMQYGCVAGILRLARLGRKSISGGKNRWRSGYFGGRSYTLV